MRVTFAHLGDIESQEWTHARNLLVDDLQRCATTINQTWGISHNPDGTQIAGGGVSRPIGEMTLWPVAVAPEGWLLCDGSQVSRATYKPLFDVITTTFGAGDGSTTFNVPDMRGRFPLGKTVAGTGSILAGTGGAIDHTHTGAAHTHTLSGSTANESSHTHPQTAHQHAIGAGSPAFATSDVGGAAPIYTATQDDIIGDDGTGAGSAHSHGVGSLTTDSAGSGATSASNPPFMAINFIIRH